MSHTGAGNSVSFSPDDQTLALTSSHSIVKLWNLRGEELQTLAGYSSAVFEVRFSYDGQILASASRDEAVKLWNFDLDDLMAKSWN